MSCHVSRLAPNPWIKTTVGNRFDSRLASKLTDTTSISTDGAGRGTAAPQRCSICAAVHPSKIMTIHPHNASTIFDLLAIKQPIILDVTHLGRTYKSRTADSS